MMPRLSHRTFLIIIAAAVLGSFLLGGCAPPMGPDWGRDHHDEMHGGRDARGDAVAEATGEAAVVIEDYAFAPGNLRIAVGTAVTWTNRDTVPHTATGDDGTWATPLLAEGEEAVIRFETRGIYDYYCEPHPNMRGRIEVVS